MYNTEQIKQEKTKLEGAIHYLSTKLKEVTKEERIPLVTIIRNGIPWTLYLTTNPDPQIEITPERETHMSLELKDLTLEELSYLADELFYRYWSTTFPPVKKVVNDANSAR